MQDKEKRNSGFDKNTGQGSSGGGYQGGGGTQGSIGGEKGALGGQSGSVGNQSSGNIGREGRDYGSQGSQGGSQSGQGGMSGSQQRSFDSQQGVGTQQRGGTGMSGDLGLSETDLSVLFRQGHFTSWDELTKFLESDKQWGTANPSNLELNQQQRQKLLSAVNGLKSSGVPFTTDPQHLMEEIRNRQGGQGGQGGQSGNRY